MGMEIGMEEGICGKIITIRKSKKCIIIENRLVKMLNWNVMIYENNRDLKDKTR